MVSSPVYGNDVDEMSNDRAYPVANAFDLANRQSQEIQTFRNHNEEDQKQSTLNVKPL